MINIKILHISIDEKFIETAFDIFEKNFPGSNTVYIYTKKKWIYVKNKKFHERKISDFFRMSFYQELDLYDVIIIHGFHDYLIPLFMFSKKRNFIWLGWGFDYYYRGNNNFFGKELILPLTNSVKNEIESNHKASFNFKKSIFKILNTRFFLKNYMRKIKIFTPVLESEYDFFINKLSLQENPIYSEWNYGCLEKHFINGFENHRITGRDILIGNNSSYTNNHIDTFDFISKLDFNFQHRKIIVPLSYGNKEYGKLVKEKGGELFPNSFLPLDDFLPKDDYIRILKSCGFVIFNNIRQQALGNIIIMLYLGSKVFLNESSPLYDYLSKKGFILYSLQELRHKPELLINSLSECEININRDKLYSIWGEDFVNNKTKEMIRKAYK